MAVDVIQALSRFPYLSLLLTITLRETLKLPAFNKGNSLRGAFGTSFRRLVCVPDCRDAHRCPLGETCPYKLIFEPSPPPGSEHLSKNQDIPRPFVFRPPLDSKTTYECGEKFEFGLNLLGTAVNYLPYFVLAFREVMAQGFGLNRAKAELSEVRAQPADQAEVAAQLFDPLRSAEPVAAAALPGAISIESPVAGKHDPSAGFLVYSALDQTFRNPEVPTLADWVKFRLQGTRRVTSAGDECPSLSGKHAPGNVDQADKPVLPPDFSVSPGTIIVRYLTPTALKSGGQMARRPKFHHLFKRVRDRINALSTFFGPGPLDADFRALGEAAEKVRTVSSQIEWAERFRTSSKTHQRHELSGFVGECSYEFPVSDSDFRSATSELPVSSFDLLQWLIAGELLHAGKHAAWGNGWYEVCSGD